MRNQIGKMKCVVVHVCSGGIYLPLRPERSREISMRIVYTL